MRELTNDDIRRMKAKAVKVKQARIERNCLLSAIEALLDATEDGDVQEVGGKPLRYARALAEKALIGD